MWIHSYSFESGSATPGLSVDMDPNSRSQNYVALNTPFTTEPDGGGTTSTTYSQYEAYWTSGIADYFLESRANPNNVFRGLDGWDIPIYEKRATGGCCYVVVKNGTNTPVSAHLYGSGINGQSDKEGQNFYANIGPYDVVNADVEGSISDNSILSLALSSSSGASMGGVSVFVDGTSQSLNQPPAPYALKVVCDDTQPKWTFVITLGYR